MRSTTRSNRVVTDLFTPNYRISGSVDVSSLKLADRLEDQTSSFLQLQEAYISSIEHPADIVASHAKAVLHKEKIIAAVVTREEDGLSRRYAYGSYRGSHVEEVSLIVPAFLIHGYVRLSGKTDLRAMLATGDRFLPVLEAEMAFSSRPDVTFTGGVILVNRGHIEVLWKEEAAHG